LTVLTSSSSPIAAGRSAADPVLPLLVADLLRAAAFAHPAQDLRLVETHISWVILAGPYAYKLKKPVDFGFLDFTTLERRRADCEAEVALNRRLCADLYLGVVDVVQRDGRYCIGPPGVPLEPAVWMRRLPDSGMLPALLARGSADERLMVRLARHLTGFHATAATGSGVNEYGGVATLRHNWEENFAQTEPFVGRTLTTEVRDFIRTYVNTFLIDQRPLLERRVAEGRIRDGHGDLHTGSVCVAGRRLYLFDCIEFNQRFRCADVAAEVAFLAMDLAHLGRADLADAFVDAYIAASGDGELRELLDFYTCYRAYVRAKVLCFRLDEPELSAADTVRIEAEASAYFNLAWAAAGGLSRPLLVVTMGLPATGKTTLARALAGQLGLGYLSSDVLRKQLAGLRPTEHRFVGFERGLYSRASSARTYAVLRRRAARYLRSGHSVVLDATYGQPRERSAIRALAQRTGARLVVLVCRADEAVLRARLAARVQEPGTTSDARLAVWPALRAAFVEPEQVFPTHSVDTQQGVDASLRQALAIIKREAHT
jgi:aminoglycoside phosphotransferase family enzyme/predicted kinase